MKTPRRLSHYIGMIHDWSIRFFGRSINKMTVQFLRSYRCGRFSSELIPAFTFQQGKPVAIRVDIRRFR
ncbi:MAG: hypothetical protein QTN59_21070 [Candidatus Electrothrix communis]|nr:MAG: hypothetical protein QTN59_21070 [Candidatus Electrothrix communis]